MIVHIPHDIYFLSFKCIMIDPMVSDRQGFQTRRGLSQPGVGKTATETLSESVMDDPLP